MTDFDATPAYRDPKRLRADYQRFHELAVKTRDVDPVYPVYKGLSRALELDAAGRAWLVFCHVAYYHMGSSLAAFAATRRGPAEAASAPIEMPVATERRAHWTRHRLSRHLADLERTARPFGGDMDAWARHDLPDDPKDAWDALTVRLQAIDGNGRWAAFKTAEMLQQICDLPVAAPDMGHAHSSGPRHGLELLYRGLPQGNSPTAVRALNRYSDQLIGRLRTAGLQASTEETETTLCDFHSLWGGRYYVGHDIDQMLHQLNQVPNDLTGLALVARKVTLSNDYLGELNGWYGPDKARNSHYRRTGEVISR